MQCSAYTHEHEQILIDELWTRYEVLVVPDLSFRVEHVKSTLVLTWHNIVNPPRNSQLVPLP